MYSDTNLFSKKNLFNLLFLAILAVGIPLATNAIKYQQILRSRAGAAGISFAGNNIKTVGTTKYAISTTVQVTLTAPNNPQGQTSSMEDPKVLAAGGWVDKAEAHHIGTDGAEPCDGRDESGNKTQRAIGDAWDNCTAHWAYADGNGQNWCVKDGCQSDNGPPGGGVCSTTRIFVQERNEECDVDWLCGSGEPSNIRNCTAVCSADNRLSLGRRCAGQEGAGNTAGHVYEVTRITDCNGNVRYENSDQGVDNILCGGSNGTDNCRDNPVTPPTSYKWTSVCSQSCNSNSDCPRGANNAEGWCYGFSGGNKCLKLESTGGGGGGGDSCRDNPVAPPTGYKWTAICGQSCTSNSQCPRGANNQEGWCYGFAGGNKCMKLESTGGGGGGGGGSAASCFVCNNGQLRKSGGDGDLTDCPAAGGVNTTCPALSGTGRTDNRCTAPANFLTTNNASCTPGGGGGSGGQCFVCNNKKWRVDGNGCPTTYTAPACNSATNTPVPGQSGKFNWDGCTGATADTACDTGGANPTPGPPTPPPTPAAIYTVSYRLSTDPTFAGAAVKPFTAQGMSDAIVLDPDPNFRGKKTVWVEYLDSAGVRTTASAEIEIVGPDMSISGGSVVCSVDISGTSVSVNITGTDFGGRQTPGTVTVEGNNNKKLSGVTWSNTNITGTIPRSLLALDPVGTTIPLTITRASDQSKLALDTQCVVNASQISVGGSLICHAPNATQLDNVIISIDDYDTATTPFEETVSITKEGIVKGTSKAKLQKNKKYRVCLEAPGSLRKCFDNVLGSDGTVVIKDAALPVGDVIKDCTINSLDAGEVKRQMSIAVVKGKTADFNQDSVVNSIDWTCMNKDFGQSCNAKKSAVSAGACPQVITRACPPSAIVINPTVQPGQCTDYPTPCDVPQGWTKEADLVCGPSHLGVGCPTGYSCDVNSSKCNRV